MVYCKKLDDDLIRKYIDKVDSDKKITVEDVKNGLETLNENNLEYLSENTDNLDDGNYEILHEDSSVVAVLDRTDFYWTEVYKMPELSTDLVSILKFIHETLGARYSEYGVHSSHYHFIIFKNHRYRSVESHVMREIARRTKELGSVSRAVDTYAVDTGYSQASWADLTGRNPSTVSRMLDN